MRPTTTWNPPFNITSSAQVTIKAPTGGFTIANVTSLRPNTSWSHNSTYTAPIEDPLHDYFSIGLTSLGTSGFSYDSGVETPLFTFENTGNCTGPTELMMAGDPFFPPNSQNGNVGCQITTLGGGQMNAWIGNYDTMSADCSGGTSTPTCSINNVTNSPETDCNATDGSITVDASSSTSLEYSLDNGVTFQTSNQFTGLSAGSYNIVIRTPGGACTQAYSGNPVVVGGPDQPTVSIDGFQHPTDCNSANGSITLSATGGSGNYEFSIDGTNYFPSGNFTNLSGGAYTISARNSDDTCPDAGGTVTLITPSSPFFDNVSFTHPTICNGSNGSISVSALGGTGSYQYSINGGSNWSNSGIFTGLSEGNYALAIRNSDGTCPVNGTTVSLDAPNGLTLTVSKTDPSACNTADGTITVFANGGSGNYLYSIDNGATWLGSGNFTGLGDGDYIVLAKNADDSCETAAPNNPISLNEPACPGNCLVDYVLEMLPDGRYQVSVLPHVTWNSPQNITSTAQVTVLAPAGGFQVTNLTNLIPTVSFAHNATYAAPTENTAQDYFVFGLTSNATSGISYQQGVKTPLFTFENGGMCTGNEVFLLDNNSDPFLPPNSQNGNVGQQLSTLGGGPDVDICTSTLGVPCEVPIQDISCLIAYELELLPDGKYQVSLIPDTTWTGVNAITSTAQVTVVAPTQGLQVTNLTDLISGVDFENNATYTAPNENPNKDYFLFGLVSNGTQNIPYVKGEKVPLFTFENTAMCTGDSIYLMPIEGDPFLPPNSQNANAGQQLTTGGSGPDANLCIVGGAVPCIPCGVNSLDTDGDGYCDNEENQNGTNPNDPCDPDLNANNCDFECPEIFGVDTIIWNGNNGPLPICTNINPADWDIHDIIVDEQPYMQPVMPCQNDTLRFYTYAFTVGQGNDGPYELVYWFANSIPYSAIIQDMDELAAMMAIWDNGGNWVNNPNFSAVSGGQMGVTYGNMEIRHIQSQVVTFIQPNFTFVSSGSIIEVDGIGCIPVVVSNPNTDCGDTLMVDIYRPDVDTIYTEFTPDSTSTTVCVDNLEIPMGNFTTSICGMPQYGTFTDNGDGCFEYTPDEFYNGLDEMCVVICSDTDPIVCEDFFDNDTIYLAAENGEANLCVPVASPAIDAYDILIDNTPYAIALEDCNKDTLIFFSYAFVNGQGNNGPYAVDSWIVNGIDVGTIIVNTMDDLAAWMNSVDNSATNWQNTNAFAAISGGNPMTNYGVMQLRHVQSNVPTQIQPNYTTLVNGSELTLNGIGEHEVIFYNQQGECGDTAIVILVEPMVDTVNVIIPTDSTEVEICLDSSELPGNPTTINVCNNPDNGTVTIDNATCVTYEPNAGFFGEDEFCVVICDDSLAPGPFCDTTIITVITPPTIDSIGPIIVDPVDTTVVCLTDVLQFPGTITNSSLCGQDPNAVDVTPIIDGCYIIDPVDDFVGETEICVVNCYESDLTMTEICDTTIITIFVPPVTDTVEVVLTEWMPFDTCFDEHINLAGNNISVDVCGENADQVDATLTSLNCINLDPQIGFQGNAEVCVINCDDSNPAICDTTIFLIEVNVPCPEVFESDTLYSSNGGVCTPISPDNYGLYDILVNGAPYTFPAEGCQEDTLVFYSYAFTQGQGSAGPYEVVSWDLNGSSFSGLVQDMDGLAAQMNVWNPNSNWTNSGTSLSVSNQVMGDAYGNLILRRVATGVETVMQPNFTEIAQGSHLTLGSAGTHEVIMTDTVTNCSDTVIVITIDVTTDTTTTVTNPGDPTDPICIDNEIDLPGNITTDFCNNSSDGTVVFNDIGCLIYTPDPNFVGIDEICVISCSDVPTSDNEPLCDTTIIQILVLPPTDMITMTLDEPDPIVVCLDTELQFSGTIISSLVCNENLSEVDVTTNTTSCISLDPVDDFVGVSDACVMHCYEALGMAFCDTTYIQILVLPPTDTVDVEIIGFNPDTLCLSNTDAIQLPGNIVSATVCGQNTTEVVATILNNDCIELDPVDGYEGPSEVCIVHCDDSNPQLCDTTIININIIFPCEDIWAEDTLIINNPKLCAPIPLGDYGLYEVIVDGSDYTFPPEPCNEDSLVFYTYSFTVGAGNSGPYNVNWEVGDQNFSGIVQDMDELAALLTTWDGSGQWVNDPSTTSVRRESSGNIYGTMILTHLQTSVPAFLMANYTSVALGTCLQIGDAGWHEVIVTDDNGCSDTVQVFYYNIDTDIIDVETENDTPTDEICLDTDGLPGNIVSVNLCNQPTLGTVDFDGTCLTFFPNDFVSGNEQLCVVVCDDTSAPFGPLCDTTLINITIGEPDCTPIFDQSSYTINETPGTGSGTFCTPILPSDWNSYDVIVNGAAYSAPPIPCDVTNVIFYSYSFTVGNGQDGPYTIEFWEFNGNVFSGSVADMDALATFMNQIDPAGNWENDPSTFTVRGGSVTGTYGNLIIKHNQTGIPTTIMSNVTPLANGSSMDLPVGTNTVSFFNPSNGCTHEAEVIVNSQQDVVIVHSRVFLQGAYNSNTGMMRDDLRALGLIPLQEPYSNYNPIAGVFRFNHVGSGGGETINPSILTVNGPDAIVDWVFLELRSGMDNEEVVSTRAALLQRDGDIVDVDGVSPVTFNAPADDYYLAIRHRNHLSVMSANSFSLSLLVTMADFTDANTPMWGTEPMNILSNGQQVLWGGDANGSGMLAFQGGNNDPDAIFFEVLLDPANTSFNQNFTVNGYNSGDTNMDGSTIYQGTSNDVDNMIFFNVIAHPSSNFVINFVIFEQLP